MRGSEKYAVIKSESITRKRGKSIRLNLSFTQTAFFSIFKKKRKKIPMSYTDANSFKLALF